MLNKFIFDVDGTLTPSRGKIDNDFREWFTEFCIDNEVYLVTGSDYPKTVEQLGEKLCRWPVYIFNCSGNDVWAKGKNIETNSWSLPDEAHKWLEIKLKNSSFPLRTGQHIEIRPGTVNFSIVGRGATLSERIMYKKWDQEHDERNRISIEFNHQFPTLESRIGGETGIDIYPKGHDKSQILKYFDKNDNLYFFGDKCTPGGNDYPLAKLIKNSYSVKNWQDTWERLEYFKEAGIAK
jgi:phosphomannomutase